MSEPDWPAKGTDEDFYLLKNHIVHDGQTVIDSLQRLVDEDRFREPARKA